MALGAITESICKYMSPLDTTNDREAMHEFILRNAFCREMTESMVGSIKDNIGLSAKPLSEEMFLIKKILYYFQENIGSWRSDLSSNGGKKNFESVISKYTKQNDEYRKIAENLQTNFESIEKSFGMLLDRIEQILGNSERIEEISSKISLLSINAAIESTKAGIFGKGFKVISIEIEKLSSDTRTFAENIKRVIEDARLQAENSISGFHGEENTLLEKINAQREDFGEFYTLLQDYNQDFNKIFSLVDSVYDDINTHIKKVNPVFQLQDITVQQIGNLKKIIEMIDGTSGGNNLMEHIFRTLSREKKSELLNELISAAEKIVTTEHEIDIINLISEKYNLNRKIVINGKKSGEIELFR